MEKPNIEKEMNDPYDEIEETLPFEKTEEKEFRKEEKDYLDDFNQQTNQNRNFSQPLMFNEDSRSDNLVIWQLRVDWNRVEHIVRGHKPKVDEEGNEFFVKIEDHYLNEYGVNTTLHFLSFYLSKEIFLARYTKEDVQLRLKQFSTRFINFFYNNLNEFGLDTTKKKKMAPMFVQSVIDLVDASYSRAIEGKTADLINKQFSVMQNQPLETNPFIQPQQKKPSMMNRLFG